MRSKKIIALLLMFSIIFSGSLTCAEKLDDLKEQKETEQQNLDNKKKHIDDMTAQKDSLFAQIVEKEKMIKQLDDELQKLEELILKISEEIDQSNKKIEQIEKRIKKNEDLFKKRVRVMYGNKDLNSVEILFSASNIRDFISRYFMMQSIAEYDKKLITALKNDKALLVKEKEALEEKKQEKVKAKKDKEIKLQTYSEEVAKNKDLISQLEENITFTESEVSDLERKVRELDANISFEEKVKAEILRKISERKLQEQIAAGETVDIPTNGEMGWPLIGYNMISSYFGPRPSIFGTFGVERHTGIDIPAPMGTPVYSATDGVVLKSGWDNTGFGNMVMIQYTNNITIIYGHNSSLVATPGQRVSKGQVISLVGSTGYSTGPHLHFEVRVNGSPVNPLPYLRS